MPDYIDSPDYLNPKRPKRSRHFVIFLALLVALWIVIRIAFSGWVDLLWFESLGYGSVFWKTFFIECIAFLLPAAITFVVLYAAFTLIRRSHGADLPTYQAIVLRGQPVNLSVAPALRVISLLVSGAVALITGLAMMAQWPTLALFWYAPHASGPIVDPIFSRPLNFFLFTLPAWRMVDSWLLTLALATCAVAVLFLVITSGSRTLGARRLSLAPSPWRGLSFTFAFLLLVLAMTTFVSRFELLLDHHTLFDGMDYTSAHIMSGGLICVAIALLLGAILAAFNGLRTARANWIIASVLPAVISYGVLTLVSWYVASFIVKPNQLVREEPFIAHNIQLTRQAYGLDHFSQSEFPAEATIEAADPAHNQTTLQNIRLWDWRALRDTLRQVQEIRTYYDFPDIDIDRYVINGKLQQVMLAVRELNVEKLPVSSRNWINERLIYTHGYGITMNPVNGFTPEGLPNLLLSNMPVQSTVPGLKVTRPELYFGELTDTDVYVKTRQQEFDYPQGQANNVTSYQGTGGIPLGGFLRRIVIA